LPFQHFGNARRRDAVVAVAALLDAGDQPPLGELAEMSTRRLRRHTRGIHKLACRERVAAHQRRKNIGTRGIANQCRDFSHANVCCHGNILVELETSTPNLVCGQRRMLRPWS
jgi:hypothetical protein